MPDTPQNDPIAALVTLASVGSIDLRGLAAALDLDGVG